MEDQKKIWNNIAPEWHEYKTRASDLSIEFLNKQKGNVLDLGSGSGRHLMKIKNGKMFLTDFSEDMINLAQQKAKEEKIDAEFAYEDNFFDAGISISAIHCTPQKDHEKIVNEIHRVLKPGAQFLIGVWNKDSKRFKRYKDNERYIGWGDKGKRYYYLFTEKEIHDLFKQAGFNIIQIQNSELMIRFVVQK